MSPSAKVRILWLAAAGLAPVAACGSLSGQLEPCGQIPDGGCPIGRGGTCADTECAALYDCVEGSWTSVETCPGGATGAGGSGAGAAATGAGGCTPVTIDHTGETFGCMPDLQSPDCPASAAEGCAETACLTDCSDFLLCVDGGWLAVAYCDERGKVQVKVTR